MSTAAPNRLLAEQMAYYRAVAPDYDDAAQRDVNQIERPELEAAVDAFRPRGDVLELAAGTGQLTVLLAQYATRVTVVDASEEALAINRTKTADRSAVEYVQADIFEWRPPRRYDVVLFSFWLSHVPSSRFDAFWTLVEEALRPGGRVFFIDSAIPRFEPADHVRCDYPERGVSVREVGGRRYRVVKVFWEPEALRQRLRTLGFDVAVRYTTHGHCIYGNGCASHS